MMLKALFFMFDMSERLYTFLIYDTPMSVNSSTAMPSSPKYAPMYLSTESNPESSRWDMIFPVFLCLNHTFRGGWIPTGGSGLST